VGLNLYVLKSVAPDVPLTTVLKGSFPFVLIMFGAIALIAVFPQIALWLPGRMMGG
jgi:TRAP-type C4-dicarboxylate transport system permease large subunit